MTGQRVTSDLAVLAGGCEWEGSDSISVNKEGGSGWHAFIICGMC